MRLVSSSKRMTLTAVARICAAGGATVERLHAEGSAAPMGRDGRARLAFSFDPGNQCAALLDRSRSAITLEGQAMGRSPDDLAAECCAAVPQADAPPAAARLTVVRTDNSATDSCPPTRRNSHRPHFAFAARDLMTGARAY